MRGGIAAEQLRNGIIALQAHWDLPFHCCEVESVAQFYRSLASNHIVGQCEHARWIYVDGSSSCHPPVLHLHFNLLCHIHDLSLLLCGKFHMLLLLFLGSKRAACPSTVQGELSGNSFPPPSTRVSAYGSP